MKSIGKSSLWIRKYRPDNFDDIITTPKIHDYLASIRDDGETPNLILDGPAGTGKTTIAYAIARELGVDPLFIPASLDTSIDDIRFTVQGYATTESLYSDKTKIVILDEFDRLSDRAMDSLKSLIEITEENCRYIFTTNNIHRIIEPVTSRCQQWNFGVQEKDRKDLMFKYWKRAKWILENEKVPFDPKILSQFVQKMYPDFRKTLNELHQYSKANGSIDAGVMNLLDSETITDIVAEMKAKNFPNLQQLARDVDPNAFYAKFYDDIKDHLKVECIPDVIVILGEYCHRHTMSNDPEINLIACLVEIVREAKWK